MTAPRTPVGETMMRPSGLFDVRPGKSYQGMPERLLTDPELASQLTLRDDAGNITAPRLSNLIGGQFRRADLLSAQVIAMPPAFTVHIAQVVLPAAQEQVSGVDAVPNVAGVTNVHALRCGAVSDFIGHAVSGNVLPSHGDQSVAIPHRGPAPDVACTGSINLRREPISFKCGVGEHSLSHMRNLYRFNCTHSETLNTISTDRQFNADIVGRIA